VGRQAAEHVVDLRGLDAQAVARDVPQVLIMGHRPVVFPEKPDADPIRGDPLIELIRAEALLAALIWLLAMITTALLGSSTISSTSKGEEPDVGDAAAAAEANRGVVGRASA